MQQAAALNELYRAAASKLNDGCRGVEGALRNATACQESLLAFDAGLRQLDDIGSVNNELFIRGRNIASRAVAYQMSVAILERTCEQAVMAHNRHRLVVASLLSLRCEAAARHLSLDRATLADNRRVVTRSMLMLGATVLPRHRIACAAADCHEASCALLLAAALDLCRHVRLRAARGARRRERRGASERRAMGVPGCDGSHGSRRGWRSCRRRRLLAPLFQLLSPRAYFPAGIGERSPRVGAFAGASNVGQPAVAP